MDQVTIEGRVFSRRPGKLTVRHVVDAERQAGTNSGMAFGMAVMAQMILIDGKPAIADDLMDLDIVTEFPLLEELLPDLGNFTSRQGT
jgi:hypothetical protein